VGNWRHIITLSSFSFLLFISLIFADNLVMDGKLINQLFNFPFHGLEDFPSFYPNPAILFRISCVSLCIIPVLLFLTHAIQFIFSRIFYLFGLNRILLTADNSILWAAFHITLCSIFLFVLPSAIALTLSILLLLIPKSENKEERTLCDSLFLLYSSVVILLSPALISDLKRIREHNIVWIDGYEVVVLVIVLQMALFRMKKKKKIHPAIST